jgi:hypothetical protein
MTLRSHFLAGFVALAAALRAAVRVPGTSSRRLRHRRLAKTHTEGGDVLPNHGHYYRIPAAQGGRVDRAWTGARRAMT